MDGITKDDGFTSTVAAANESLHKMDNFRDFPQLTNEWFGVDWELLTNQLKIFNNN